MHIFFLYIFLRDSDKTTEETGGDAGRDIKMTNSLLKKVLRWKKKTEIRYKKFENFFEEEETLKIKC